MNARLDILRKDGKFLQGILYIHFDLRAFQQKRLERLGMIRQRGFYLSLPRPAVQNDLDLIQCRDQVPTQEIAGDMVCQFGPHTEDPPTKRHRDILL